MDSADLREKIKDFFNGDVEYWICRDTPERRRVVVHFLSEWLSSPHKPLVDIGGGTGIASAALIEAGYVPGQIVILDISEQMLSVARKALPEAGCVVGAAELLPIKTGVAERVLVFDAIPHMNPGAAIAEIRRILSPGGELVILHDTCHYRINQVHFRRGEPVKHHVLLPLQKMAQILSNNHFYVAKQLEIPKKVYFLKAVRK